MADNGGVRRSGRRSLTVILFLLCEIVLLSLGTWQVQRLHWKEALLAEIDARRKAEPVDVAEIERRVRAGEQVDYTPVTATGHFLNKAERYFLATRDGQPGFHVYTPLLLADGRSVMVNRGFVPEARKDPATRVVPGADGEVTVRGLARDRLPKKPSWLVPENEPKKNLFFWKDLQAMASSAGLDSTKLLPFFIDAGPQAQPAAFPIGGVTQVDLPNNHLSYAVTWYGLAAALAVIAALSGLRSGKRR